jgi:hypothetical protein
LEAVTRREDRHIHGKCIIYSEIKTVKSLLRVAITILREPDHTGNS